MHNRETYFSGWWKLLILYCDGFCYAKWQRYKKFFTSSMLDHTHQKICMLYSQHCDYLCFSTTQMQGRLQVMITVGLLNQFSPFHYFYNFLVIKTLGFFYWISNSYLAGVTTVQLCPHLTKDLFDSFMKSIFSLTEKLMGRTLMNSTEVWVPLMYGMNWTMGDVYGIYFVNCFYWISNSYLAGVTTVQLCPHLTKDLLNSFLKSICFLTEKLIDKTL